MKPEQPKKLTPEQRQLKRDVAAEHRKASEALDRSVGPAVKVKPLYEPSKPKEKDVEHHDDVDRGRKPVERRGG